MARLWYLALLLVFPVSAVSADLPVPADSAGGLPAPPFSVTALLTSARSAGFAWSPRWPREIPPDAFRLNRGDFSAITLSGPGGELSLRRGPGGVWEEFPFLLEGAFFPARTRFDPAGAITGFTLNTDPPWEIEFLPGGGFLTARVSPGATDDAAGDARGDARGDAGAGEETGGAAPGGPYFVALSGDAPRFIETWFDQEGAALAIFTGESRFLGDVCRIVRRERRDQAGTFTESFAYDSGGNISALTAGETRFSALYAPGNYPRYWERLSPGDEGRYHIQWDQRSRAVRMTLLRQAAGEESAAFRYEYAEDARGNWIERREIPLIRRYGFLVPAPELLTLRRIEYAPGGPP
jgi:hypothetical protein